MLTSPVSDFFLEAAHTEANSSIECFNDKDETVLQGETQYKYAE